MSYITDVVLHINYDTSEVHSEIEKPFDQHSNALRHISTERAGGSKVFTGDIYAGSFNYLDYDHFVNWLSNLPWDKYSMATLSMITEGEYQRVGTIKEGNLILI